jgi:predicted RND superfamily exporter protein
VFYQVLDEYVFLPAEDGDVSIYYRITGTPIITNHINNQLFTQQIESLILAFIIIYLLLLLQFRSLKKSIIAIVPILMPVYTSFGLMDCWVFFKYCTLMVAASPSGREYYTIIYFTLVFRIE